MGDSLLMKRYSWIATLVTVVLLAAAPTSAPVLARAAQAAPKCQPGDQVWIGSFGYGVNCLDVAGWHTFNKQNGSVSSDQTAAIAFCNGKVWIANTLGISMT